MDVHVNMGEWINSLTNRMSNAADGDCFYLPTLMHLHAYTILKDGPFADRNFKVEVKEQKTV
mgnify:CR=1 FL=1